MLGLLPLLCVLLPFLVRVYANIVATDSIGNQGAGLPQPLLSTAAFALFFGARWDGDKVRGLALKLSDGTGIEVGDYSNNNYQLTTFNFNPGETLVTAFLRDSGYGYGSLRQIQFSTSQGRTFYAGPSGFDNEVSLNVNGSVICGLDAWVNSDNFINALLFYVNLPPPPPPRSFAWSETQSVGNKGASSSEVQIASNSSTVRYIAVRWDNDKIHGVSVTLHDQTTKSAGGIGDVSNTLTSYEFSDGEELTYLDLESSPFGYTSLCKISFKTNLGGSFTAGGGGCNDAIQPPIYGSELVGFNAWVNSDNFINAFAARVTKD